MAILRALLSTLKAFSSQTIRRWSWDSRSHPPSYLPLATASRLTAPWAMCWLPKQGCGQLSWACSHHYTLVWATNGHRKLIVTYVIMLPLSSRVMLYSNYWPIVCSGACSDSDGWNPYMSPWSSMCDVTHSSCRWGGLKIHAPDPH